MWLLATFGNPLMSAPAAFGINQLKLAGVYIYASKLKNILNISAV
jgi:hypothetical protein